MHDAETGAPIGAVAQLEAVLAASDNTASKTSPIHLHPDCPHAFHDDQRTIWRKELANDD